MVLKSSHLPHHERVYTATGMEQEGEREREIPEEEHPNPTLCLLDLATLGITAVPGLPQWDCVYSFVLDGVLVRLGEMPASTASEELVAATEPGPTATRYALFDPDVAEWKEGTCEGGPRVRSTGVYGVVSDAFWVTGEGRFTLRGLWEDTTLTPPAPVRWNPPAALMERRRGMAVGRFLATFHPYDASVIAYDTICNEWQ
ncbi:hypothetical protein KIPB_002825, partial [Kipferlia bialata]|eukprot:g2825.t1